VAEAEARPAQPEAAIRGKRILVVDDEPEVANVLVDLLKLDDHQAATAANGALALDTLRKQTYDLILSDIKMPELDGPGLYRKLMRRHPEMLQRFIFLTGDMLSPETRAFVERTGAPMISKPFAIDEIRQSVERALRVPVAEPAQPPPRAKGFFTTG
jgi:CheY-like chemotaxis protein